MIANVLRKISAKTPVGLLRFFGNIWLPYLGAGIKILEASGDFRYCKVGLKRTWYNANYVGTQFGGSMYSMTDPFFMLMLINNLGKDYIVWDKAAKIDFIKPGKTMLIAEFKIDQSLIDLIKEKTKNSEKYIFDLPIEIFDTDKNLIAKVEKTLYVRLKKDQRATVDVLNS